MSKLPNYVCILDPTTHKQTTNLKEDSFIYMEKIDEFEIIGDKFGSTMQELGAEIVKQKIKSMEARNLLQLMEKQKENDQQQMSAMINEVPMEVEKQKIQLISLQKTEAQQVELLTRVKRNN